MELPLSLKLALDKLSANIDTKELIKLSAELSASYINREIVGKSVVNSFKQASVYALARMPATYGAISSAIAQTFKDADIVIDSVIDVGAGTGSASFAISEMLGAKQFVCIEREEAMAKIAQTLMQDSPCLAEAKWLKSDVTTSAMPCEADMVVAGYCLNEVTEAMRQDVVLKLWQASKKVLLIIEPGTPECYSQLIKIRQNLIKIGANQLAPCPHDGSCQLKDGDWCNFACRVGRTKLHKLLKGGDCPYEDEKFCYMAFSKQQYPLPSGRVLRHPIYEKEKVKLKICSSNGVADYVAKKGVSKIYKQARKVDAGEAIDCGELCKM